MTGSSPAYALDRDLTTACEATSWALTAVLGIVLGALVADGVLHLGVEGAVVLVTGTAGLAVLTVDAWRAGPVREGRRDLTLGSVVAAWSIGSFGLVGWLQLGELRAAAAMAVTALAALITGLRYLTGRPADPRTPTQPW